MTVGEAVMNIKGWMPLSVADGQSEVNQRLALVEVRRGAFVRWVVKLDNLESRREKVIGNQLMPPVRIPLEVSAKDRVRLQQRGEGSRQGIDIDRTLEMCAKTDEMLCLG
jgi:hypothetical protein